VAGQVNWDAALYENKHAFVWQRGASLIELLAPQAGERIVDLGCGTGQLTAQIAAVGAEVIGIDSSPAMIETATRNYPELCFQHADARLFSCESAVDAVFSNAVLHWIREPEKVIACVRRVLKAGGRFVAEFGGKGNVQTIVAALENTAASLGCRLPQSPWYFPSVAEYAALLEHGGLEVRYAALFDRPTALDGEHGLRHWIAMFAGHVLHALAADQHETFLTGMEEKLRPGLYRDGAWFADYRRLRIVAVRE